MGHDYLEKPLPEWIEGDTEQCFTRIFEQRFWGPGESPSGPGSSTSQTRTLAKSLPTLLKELGVGSLLDVPCGDFHWMSQISLPLQHYIGADTVPALIDANRFRYGSPTREFFHLDLIRDALPKADLILCRDGLVHLCLNEVHQALENFRQSSSGLLLATTFPAHSENVDITTGDWRPLNLAAVPFSLGEPLMTLEENCPEPGYEDKALGLWSLNC